MRNKVEGFVDVRAIAGTHVTFLAFDMAAADAQALMGFAIQRTDFTEDEVTWLRGNKTFASVRSTSGLEDASSHQFPFQAFQWADYTAKPGHHYHYRVIPMFGPPGALTDGPATTVAIDTEPSAGARHSVHFNRAAIASQAFARHFPGQTLEQAGPPAYAWLARDLLPAMLAFIGRASDPTWSLRVAMYELHWPEVLTALRTASDAGADVRIVYHALDDDTGRANEPAIDAAGIRPLCQPRRHARLMHNKFMVLSHDGTPVSVWTGSTNLSQNALFGQLNVGHEIHDEALATRFLELWTELSADPPSDALKDWIGTENPLPPVDETAALTRTFSPHHGRKVFDWWIDLADRPRPLFMTFPFGIVKDFRPVFDKSDGVLRFALLDKYVNGGNAASRAAAIADIERIRRRPNIGMAVAGNVFVDWIDGWLKESPGIGVHVNWVHTKFMLIDPLGDDPATMTGSANFSQPSVDTNDENMVLIRGDTRVADIYFGEFMRLFAHHRFRESVRRHVEREGIAAVNSWRPSDLFEDPAQWVPAHFRAGSEKDIKRRYFAGD